jgi:nitrogen regulatory protein PII
MIEKVGDQFKLIVIIVKRDLSREVIQSCIEAGAEGGTVLQGKGTGRHETGSVFGIKVEPEKDIILCLAADDTVDEILKQVTAAVKLDVPDTGIAFVINSKSVTGIAHLLEKDF